VVEAHPLTARQSATSIAGSRSVIAKLETHEARVVNAVFDKDVVAVSGSARGACQW
jgi:predicted Rossmann fold nucleotide-binding protein DprA/Smf involved in DNA uptake